jgi:hypothetical protein
LTAAAKPRFSGSTTISAPSNARRRACCAADGVASSTITTRSIPRFVVRFRLRAASMARPGSP